jgi:hypothetical protein
MLVSNGSDISPPQITAVCIANNGVDYDESIQKALITSVVSDNTENIRCLVVIKTQDGKSREINLAEVTNQTGWTNSEAGTIQAIADINGWIAQTQALFEGFNKITVSATEPVAPTLNQIWIPIT